MIRQYFLSDEGVLTPNGELELRFKNYTEFDLIIRGMLIVTERPIEIVSIRDCYGNSYLKGVLELSQFYQKLTFWGGFLGYTVITDRIFDDSLILESDCYLFIKVRDTIGMYTYPISITLICERKTGE